jgi:hypothetical protein
MRRLFWMGVGVAVGALLVRKMTRVAESFTPRGIAGSARESATGLLESVRDFVDDARAASAAREGELRAALDAGEDVSEMWGRGRHAG